ETEPELGDEFTEPEEADDAAEAEPVTQPEEKQPYTVNAQEGVFVYDGADVLSEAEEAEVSETLKLLYEKYLINAAVVTADAIGDDYPYTFAQNAYNTIYEGRGSGFLLLINNDTNYDSLYRTGRCQTYITDSDENEAFYWATRDIVGGDYKSAVLRMLELAKKCPEHIFDNIDKLSQEQAEQIEKQLADCDADISLLVTTNSTGKTNDEVCRSYYDRRYSDGQGYMVMLDADNNTFTIVSDQSLPSGLERAKAMAEKLAGSGKIAEAIKEIAGKLS
ncbi:MAG: TPM domain-containing protein, partial [Ruminococcus sp.]|nr:TPM domain-containing protein [Ruminococcus sp.]